MNSTEHRWPVGTKAVSLVILLFTLLLTSSAVAVGTAVPVNIIWRVSVGPIPDRMSTPFPSERDAFPLEGAIFYLPRSNQPGTVPLYRLFNGSDHMESLVPGEGGYGTEGVIAYPWSSPASATGVSEVIRVLNPATGDHATRHANESLFGYTIEEHFNVYGYRRYNNTAESLLPLNAGGVTVESNGVTGGALWHWIWNGSQFVNNYDYGRQIQAALFPGDGSNPTEAGDQYSNPGLIPAARHGSPVLNIHNVGTTQVTRSIPVDFNPALFGGGPDNPVVWKDIVIGKDLTLNFNNMGPVAKYTTVLTVPSPLVGAVEIPTGYLRSSFGRYWTYNAEGDVLTEVLPGTCTGTAVQFFPSFGGVIVSDGSTSFAMGVYGVSTANGGSVTYFTLWNFFCVGDGPGEFANDTSKWSAAFQGSVGAGTTIFNTWVMTGTVSEVANYMRSLYLLGVR